MKISDFGLSNSSTSTVQLNDKIHGTIQYLAPETILANEITKSVDFWALGINI